MEQKYLKAALDAVEVLRKANKVSENGETEEAEALILEMMLLLPMIASVADEIAGLRADIAELVENITVEEDFPILGKGFIN